MLKIVFCDDNREFLSAVRTQVERECLKLLTKDEEYSLGPFFGSGKELIDYVASNYVDVVMLDIDMPELNGFEVAKILCRDYKQIKIVFMSAYDNFVYSAFEFYPFAYLRKSHLSQELPEVLGRIIEKLREPERRLMLFTIDGPKVIDVNSIVYVESKRNYYAVYLLHGREYLCRGTLTDFEREVSKYDFYRVHSAYLVNLEQVEKMLESGDALVFGHRVPVAQKRVQAFKKAYMEYLRRSLGT